MTANLLCTGIRRRRIYVYFAITLDTIFSTCSLLINLMIGPGGYKLLELFDSFHYQGTERIYIQIDIYIYLLVSVLIYINPASIALISLSACCGSESLQWQRIDFTCQYNISLELRAKLRRTHFYQKIKSMYIILYRNQCQAKYLMTIRLWYPPIHDVIHLPKV